MDKEWIVNFAKSVIDNKLEKSELNEAASISQKLAVQDKINFFCSDLFEEAKSYIEIFNIYAADTYNLKAYPRKQNDDSGLSGFYLLLKSSRAHVYLNNNNSLCVELDSISGYHIQNKGIFVLFPFVDYYGTLMWKADDLSLLSREHVLKFVLERLLNLVKSE